MDCMVVVVVVVTEARLEKVLGDLMLGRRLFP